MASLKSKMLERNISMLDIQNALNCTEKTARNKVNGKSAFTFPETLEIRKQYFPDLSLECLFGDKVS